MDTAIVLTTLVRIAIAAGLAYVVWFVVAPRGRATTPFQLGRKWVAWPCALVIFTVALNFVRTGETDDLRGGLLLLVLSVVVFFPIGYVIGRFRGLGAHRNETPPSGA